MKMQTQIWFIAALKTWDWCWIYGCWFGFCRSALGNCCCTWLTKSIRFHIPSLFSPFPLLTVLCLNLYFKGKLPAVSENTWMLGVFKPLQLHSYKSFMFYFAIPTQLFSELCLYVEHQFLLNKGCFHLGVSCRFLHRLLQNMLRIFQDQLFISSGALPEGSWHQRAPAVSELILGSVHCQMPQGALH